MGRFRRAIERIRNFICDNDTPERPLREFIYLDETSVVSLLASLEGEITDRLIVRSEEENRRRKRTQGSISAQGTGLSRFSEKESINRSGSETIQRSVIQSRFDELYNSRQEELLLSESNNEANSEIEDDDIDRGRLMEIEVKLSIHQSYKIYKILEYIVEVFEDLNQMEDIQNLNGQGDIEEMVSFLDSLFGDQIPIQGESTNYAVRDGAIVSKSNVNEDEETAPLTIVGLLHFDSLWTDPLRAIAEEEHYTVYCRISEDGFRSEWHPTRLTRVLQDVFPQQARKLNLLLNQALIDSPTDAAPAGVDLGINRTNEEIINTYDTKIREEGATIPEQARNECRTETVQSHMLDIEPDSFSEATGILADYSECLEVKESVEIDISSDRLSEIRRTSIFGEENIITESGDLEDSNFIQTSPIGVYW